MKKQTSLKDIAQKAGVSTSLVSFVLNGKSKQHRVNEQVAERVRQIAKELDYKPNTIAKNLRSGKSRTIGVIVSDISNPFFSYLARQIEATAEKHDYSVTFSSSDEDAARTERIIDTMIYKCVDGIILVPSKGNEKKVEELISSNFPLVLMDRRFPNIKSSYVTLNNVEASRQATQHLLAEGFKKVGIIVYDNSIQHMTDRVEGYMVAMNKANRGKDILVKHVNYNDVTRTCEKAVNYMLDNGADAIILGSYNITVKCLHALTQKGVKIPKELGIVGYDSGDAFEFFYSTLTHIVQPLDTIAQKATEILIDQIESDGNITQSVEVDGSLVVLQSSLKKSLKQSQ